MTECRRVVLSGFVTQSESIFGPTWAGAAERHHLPDGANLRLQEKRKLSGDAL